MSGRVNNSCPNVPCFYTPTYVGRPLCFPFVAISLFWGYAVFANSPCPRIASWSTLIYQISRAPLVAVIDILEVESISNQSIHTIGELAKNRI